MSEDYVLKKDEGRDEIWMEERIVSKYFQLCFTHYCATTYDYYYANF